MKRKLKNNNKINEIEFRKSQKCKNNLERASIIARSLNADRKWLSRRKLPICDF